MNSFTFDELVQNFRAKAGKPVQRLDERLNNFWFVDLPGQEAGVIRLTIKPAEQNQDNLMYLKSIRLEQVKENKRDGWSTYDIE